MLDYKKYSVKEYLDNAYNYYYDSRTGTGVVLGIGDSNIQKHLGAGGVDKQNFRDSEGRTFSAATGKGYFGVKNCVESYVLYHSTYKFNECLQMTNAYYSKNIKKDGTTYMVRKRYSFKGYSFETNYRTRTSTFSYKHHQITINVPKNKTRQYELRRRRTGTIIKEKYNSKGVCISSIFHFGKFSENTVQLKKVKGGVSFFCHSTHAVYMKSIIIPNLKDASIVNLYNDLNCFNIDLFIPSSELAALYQEGLSTLKNEIDFLVENETAGLTMLRNMQQQIKDNTIAY